MQVRIVVERDEVLEIVRAHLEASVKLPGRGKLTVEHGPSYEHSVIARLVEPEEPEVPERNEVLEIVRANVAENIKAQFAAGNAAVAEAPPLPFCRVDGGSNTCVLLDGHSGPHETLTGAKWEQPMAVPDGQ